MMMMMMMIALEAIFNVMRSINPRFTYLITYLLTAAAIIMSFW